MANAPYDSVYAAILIIKSRIGDDIDSLLPLGGQIGGNSQAYSQQIFNTGYRKLQQFLVSEGYEKLSTTHTLIAGLPPVNSPDASLQVTLSWTGYNDGVNTNTGFVLPQDLIRATKLAERPSQSAPNVSQFWDMDGPENGIKYIPDIPKDYRNRIWLWSGDKITMPGATGYIDLRVDYQSYLPDFADTGDVTSATNFTAWYNQPLPIMRAAEALANYALAEIERARDNMDAVTAYTNDGQEAAVRDILGKRPVPAGG